MKNNYVFVGNYNNGGINNKNNTVNTFDSMLLILSSVTNSIIEEKFIFFLYKQNYVYVPLERKVSR